MSNNGCSNRAQQQLRKGETAYNKDAAQERAAEGRATNSAQSAYTKATPPATAAGQGLPNPRDAHRRGDYWYRGGPYWKRVHAEPRAALYLPEQTHDRPDIKAYPDWSAPLFQTRSQALNLLDFWVCLSAAFAGNGGVRQAGGLSCLSQPYANPKPA